MGQELLNISGFKSGPAKAFAGHFTEESLADGVGGGYPLIRYGGKVWALQLRGDVIQYVTPDNYGAPYIDVVILRQARNKSKAYFPNWEEGSKDAPVCTSLDGLVPDPGVEDRQSATCASCPRNVFKPNEKGMKVKECSDAKRLAVFPLIPSNMLNATGGPVVEPTFLRVPAASLQNLAQMGEAARKAGYDYFMFVCRIDFDPEKNYPKMRFRAHQALTDKEAEAVLKLREDPQSYRIVSGELGGATRTIAPPQEQVQLTAPTGDTGLVVQERAQAMADVAKRAQAMADVATAEYKAQTEKAELAAKLEADRLYRLAQVKADAAAKEASQKAQQVPQQKTIELTAETVSTGLAGLSTDQNQLPVQEVQQIQTETTKSVDTGDPDQADDALDAAIAAFLPKS